VNNATKEKEMADDEYCENCGGTCDGCCGGPNKKYPTDKEQADGIVKMIMSNGPRIALLVMNELTKQMANQLLTEADDKLLKDTVTSHQ
jgi:hypothetical protein